MSADAPWPPCRPRSILYFLLEYDGGREAYKRLSAGACTDGLRIDLESRRDCGGHTNP